MPEHRSRTRKRKQSWRHSLFRGACLVFGLLTIRVVALQAFTITSGSMEPTLLAGDFVAVNKVAMGSRIPFTDIRIRGYSDPRRGEILVFDPPHDDNLTVVKRLVGMPGDTLEMRDKTLYLNGEAQDEPYALHTGDEPDISVAAMLWQREILVGGRGEEYLPTRDTWGPLVVPDGRYFMLGDNRDNSIDSRIWGLLERWRFEGRIIVRYFSYNRDSYRPFPFIREIRWDRIGRRPR